MESLLFSIIMPTYNRVHYIADAIQSVLVQSYKNWELIVVDDASTDNTKEIINEFLHKSQQIHYIKQDKNRGPSAARNVGISKARGEYIAFLDSDDIWHPEKLSQFMKLILKYPRGKLFYSDLRIFEGDEIMPKTYFQQQEIPPMQGHISIHLIPFVPVLPSAVVIKKEVFHRIGLFDEDVFVAEDIDIVSRIIKKYPIYFVGMPLTYYRIHPGQIVKNSELVMNEKIRTIKKYLPSEYHNKAIGRTYSRYIIDLHREGKTKMAFLCGFKSLVWYPRLITFWRLSQLVVPLQFRPYIRRIVYGKRKVESLVSRNHKSSP
jgi:glycosyltransferase involved in cell wall biosynthesis